VQRLEQANGETDRLQLVLRGAGERLAPIVTTALTTALTLLPFLILGDVAGLELLRPMVIVVLGGLVTSTALNLFVTPVLYLRFGGSPEQVMEFSPEPAMAG
jgi:Cu/Ag efflux pump CusA